MKVVFHVSELSKWPEVVANLKNLLKVESSGVMAIEVVANGEAVKKYTQAKFEATLQELTKQGVVLSACRNALTNFDIEKVDLPSFVRIVPAGVLRLIECQSEGYAYIKP